MKLPLVLGTAALAATALVACNDIPLVPLDDTITVVINEKSDPLGTNAVDVLWIVDNSSSMSQEQEELGRQFAAFIDAFVEIGADFQMAVITTDVSDATESGIFQTGPGNSVSENCHSPAPAVAGCSNDIGPIISAADYRAVPDDPLSELDVDRLREDFVCLASVGDCGDGFEAGLDAVEMALSPALLEGGPNDGFLRTGAFLAVIIVSDEDDCSVSGSIDIASNAQCYDEDRRSSLSPVDRFYNAIVAAKASTLPEPPEDAEALQRLADEQILVAGIIGPYLEGYGEELIACTSPGGRGDARDGKRYRELIDMFGGIEASICAEGFDAPLRLMGSRIAESLDHECLGDSRVQTCEDSRDCAEGVNCVGPFGYAGGPMFCENYEIFLDVKQALDQPYERQQGPGPISTLMVDAGGYYTTDGEAAEGVDYTVLYGDDRCSSNVSFSFEAHARPRPGAYYRVAYPIEVAFNSSDSEE